MCQQLKLLYSAAVSVEQKKKKFSFEKPIKSSA